MTITISEVQEIIKNLEGSGELSIKEEKYLKVAKLCVQLAAENVALKAAIPDELFIDVMDENIDDISLAEDIGFNACVRRIARAIQETPATDRIVAGIKADAIDEAAVELDRVDTVASTRVIGFKLREFAKQLREGADK